MDYIKQLNIENSYNSKDYLIGILSSNVDKFRLLHREMENINNQGWHKSEYYKGRYKNNRIRIKISQNPSNKEWYVVWIHPIIN